MKSVISSIHELISSKQGDTDKNKGGKGKNKETKKGERAAKRKKCILSNVNVHEFRVCLVCEL